MEVHFPAIWLRSIIKNDRPYMEAILILATCPWQKLPYSEIGKQLNLSRKQVKSAVGFLVKKGHLQRTEKKGFCPILTQWAQPLQVPTPAPPGTDPQPLRVLTPPRRTKLRQPTRKDYVTAFKRKQSIG
jgi:hypothetical protein